MEAKESFSKKGEKRATEINYKNKWRDIGQKTFYSLARYTIFNSSKKSKAIALSMNIRFFDK